jgi:hypothetical protein
MDFWTPQIQLQLVNLVVAVLDTMPSSSAPITPNNTGAPSPHQESNALPIPPVDSMLPTFLCIGTRYFPIIPSDEEFLTRDEGSDASTPDSPHSSLSQTNSTITNLMHDITDMADRVVTIDADALTADFHRVITARDNLIHSLSSPATPFRPAEVAELRRLTDEFQYFPQAHLSQWIPSGVLGFPVDS